LRACADYVATDTGDAFRMGLFLVIAAVILLIPLLALWWDDQRDRRQTPHRR
jgi:hypothetical protein